LIPQTQYGLRIFNAESFEVKVLGVPCNIESMHQALIDLDRSLESTTADLHLSFLKEGVQGDSVSIREARTKVGVPPAQSRTP